MAEPSTRAVERALELLAVVSDQGETTLTECARRSGLAPSTALRLLRTLESTGFVRRDDGGVFRPGARLIQLGAQALSRESLVGYAEPSMDYLARETGESTYLSVPGLDDTALYIAQAEGSHSIRHVSWVGHAVPMGDSAAGRALRGELPDSGYASAGSLTEPDVTAVAAPIFAPQGIIGALSLVGPAYRMDQDQVRGFGELLLAEAAKIAEHLGHPLDD